MLLIKVHDDRRSRKDWLQRRLLQPEEDQREDIVTTTHTGTKEKNLQSKSILRAPASAKLGPQAAARRARGLRLALLLLGHLGRLETDELTAGSSWLSRAARSAA